MFKTMTILTFLLALFQKLIESSQGELAASGEVTVPKLIDFSNGRIGVNFLGFRAAAGLGGLLTGNAADGGLHAEAGTPFGQSARAGLGGSVASGRSFGGLYADATAGGGIGAGAGLAGHTSGEGSFGTSYAGASAGGIFKEKAVVKQPSISYRTHKEAHIPVAEKIVEISSAPVVEKEVVEVEEKVKPQKTYVERTVIPNYVEKSIFVPSYVEKTIKVPTVVEQRVKVPAPPTVIEKEVNSLPDNVSFGKSVEREVVHPPVEITHKTKIRTRPYHHFRKHFFLGGGAGYGGDYGGSYDSAGTVSVSKADNSQLFRDIFNIPISTLGAVSNLVSGIAGGTSGSFSAGVSKSKSFGGSVY